MGEIARQGSESLSRRILGLDWGRVLPWRFDDVTVELGSFEADALPFMAEHYGAIFGTADPSTARFLVEPMTDSKRRFGAEMDVFVYRDCGRTIGMFASHPTDWSTYYMRTAALLPEYRGRHLVSRLMLELVEPLRGVGVARLEGDVTPTNAPMMKLHSGQGFIVTSTSTSDRWGMTVRFTKFLRTEAEDVFVRQFCAMAVKSPESVTPTSRRMS